MTKRKSTRQQKNEKETQEDPALSSADNSAPETPEATEAPSPAEPDAQQESLSSQLLRLRADFENYKRRVLREKDALYKRANEDIIQELLPVLDNLDIARAAAGSRMEDPVLQGFELVRNQLVASLEKFGLSPIDAEGLAFDPNLHEAISHLPSDTIAENNIIAQTRRGYKMGDQLLRAAQVVVSSGSPDSEPETNTES